MEPTIRQYDSIDAMFSDLNKAREQAAAALHAMQQGIQLGSYAVGEQHDIVFFGYIFDRETYIALENSAGAEPGEAAHTWKQVAEAAENGMLFGSWASVAEPRGEYGSNHKINLWPISEQCYRIAEANQWQISTLTGYAWQELYQALTQLQAHRRSMGYR